jgi:hypothetical protein
MIFLERFTWVLLIIRHIKEQRLLFWMAINYSLVDDIYIYCFFSGCLREIFVLLLQRERRFFLFFFLFKLLKLHWQHACLSYSTLFFFRSFLLKCIRLLTYRRHWMSKLPTMIAVARRLCSAHISTHNNALFYWFFLNRWFNFSALL